MSTTSTGAALVGLALVATLLNAAKPLTIDDTIYYQFARHIAAHPCDPYGFRVWDAQAANSVLAPPVLLYYWAMILRLGGTDPLAWKLSLLPFGLLLMATLYALGRRFAPGRALLFAVCVSLSPVVLPCWNLMLDLPALALLLLAVVVFLRALATPLTRASFAGVLLAGTIAALAAQTKYTGLLAGGFFVLAGWWYGRPALGATALGVLLALFAGWEALIAWRYGASHFYLAALQFHAPLAAKLTLIQPLFGYLGSTLVALLPLTLAALGCSGRVVAGTSAALGGWFALVLLWNAPLLTPQLCGIVFGVLGALLTVGIGALAWRLLNSSPRERDDGFLVLWLVLEVAGYFALTPYAATRRFLGVTVLATLLVCRLLARSAVPPWRCAVAVAFLAALALTLCGVDASLYDGLRQVAERTARQGQSDSPTATIWCAGVGTTEFYGLRAGMKWLKAARVRPGDRVVVFPGGEAAFTAGALATRCVPCGAVRWCSPFAALSAYQGGNLALTRNQRPEVVVRIWRVE